MSLYQFLGACDGLISDYSSVWVDFLATGRSIALYCPDIDAYRATRGFNAPDLAEVAAGLLITGGERAGEFFAAVARHETYAAGAQDACRAAIGFVDAPDHTGAMLADVAALATTKGMRSGMLR
jgi:CDP-glycerol glycerophosphotransferase (TagB/SpsB family)